VKPAGTGSQNGDRDSFDAPLALAAALAGNSDTFAASRAAIRRSSAAMRVDSERGTGSSCAAVVGGGVEGVPLVAAFAV
jgi:hypothetical protein